MSVEPSDATIYYTLDGTVPSETNGVRYLGEFNLTETATIRAIGVREGWGSSPIASRTIELALPQPVITPASDGPHAEEQTINIGATAGATIRYTLNGTIPSPFNGTIYTAPFTINGNKTVKAMAYMPGYTNSSVVSRTFTFQANPPSISPPNGTYTTSRSVSMGADSGMTIRYTIDGSNPTPTHGTVYTGAFTLTSSKTVKAIAYRTGYQASTITTRNYTIKVATPSISLAAGTYVEAKTVSLATSTPGAIIRYTLDGSNPTTSHGTVYSGPFSIGSTSTLKAVAYKSNCATSDIAQANYIIEGRNAYLDQFRSGIWTTVAWPHAYPNMMILDAGVSRSGATSNEYNWFFYAKRDCVVDVDLGASVTFSNSGGGIGVYLYESKNPSRTTSTDAGNYTALLQDGNGTGGTGTLPVETSGTVTFKAGYTYRVRVYETFSGESSFTYHADLEIK
jgi:hypothetical protein